MWKKLSGIWQKIRGIKKRWFILGFLVLAAAIFFFRPKTNPATQPQFATASRHDIKQQVSGSGTLSGKNSADLKFQGAGQLAYVNVKAGDRITQGEILAGLDQRQLSAALQQAQNTLAARQADVDKIVDDIHLSQYGNGGFGNIGSNNETQTQRDARIAAQTARDSAADTVKAAQVAIQNSVITSPLTGIVTQASLVPGQTVGLADTIVEVVDFSQKVFDTDVDESDIGKIALGQQADFTLNAYGDKNFQGTVLEISPITHTTSSGATVVTVKISADDPSIQTINGLGGQANITTAAKNNVITIPNSALRGDNSVLVQTSPNKFNSVKVTTGLANDTDVEITSGLKDGDVVVTNPGVVKNGTGKA